MSVAADQERHSGNKEFQVKVGEEMHANEKKMAKMRKQIDVQEVVLSAPSHAALIRLWALGSGLWA